MPAVRGRAAAPRGEDGTVPLQGRVHPRIRQKARDVADAAGISIAVYLERLIERDELDANGVPTWLEPSAPRNQEVLPLGKTA